MEFRLLRFCLTIFLDDSYDLIGMSVLEAEEAWEEGWEEGWHEAARLKSQQRTAATKTTLQSPFIEE